jgi:hypothetical protein
MKSNKLKCIIKDLEPELLYDKEYEIHTEDNKFFVIRETGAKLYIDEQFLDVFFETNKTKVE